MRDDSVVLEDGHPQTIVGFEARALEQLVLPTGQATAAIPTVATNLDAAVLRGRMLVLLVDDLGLVAAHGPAGRRLFGAAALTSGLLDRRGDDP